MRKLGRLLLLAATAALAGLILVACGGGSSSSGGTSGGTATARTTTPATWRLGFRRRRPWHVRVPDLRGLREIQLGGIGSDHLFLDGGVDQPGQDR